MGTQQGFFGIVRFDTIWNSMIRPGYTARLPKLSVIGAQNESFNKLAG